MLSPGATADSAGFCSLEAVTATGRAGAGSGFRRRMIQEEIHQGPHHARQSDHHAGENSENGPGQIRSGRPAAQACRRQWQGCLALPANQRTALRRRHALRATRREVFGRSRCLLSTVVVHTGVHAQLANEDPSPSRETRPILSSHDSGFKTHRVRIGNYRELGDWARISSLGTYGFLIGFFAAAFSGGGGTSFE